MRITAEKSRNWIIVIILLLALGGGGYYYLKFHDDRNERIIAATEILKNNRDDVIDLATAGIKSSGIKTVISILADGSSDCIIDSLAVRLADKFSLTELNDLKTKPASNLIEMTKLVEENLNVCEKCLSFKN